MHAPGMVIIVMDISRIEEENVTTTGMSFEIQDLQIGTEGEGVQDHLDHYHPGHDHLDRKSDEDPIRQDLQTDTEDGEGQDHLDHDHRDLTNDEDRIHQYLQMDTEDEGGQDHFDHGHPGHVLSHARAHAHGHIQRSCKVIQVQGTMVPVR